MESDVRSFVPMPSKIRSRISFGALEAMTVVACRLMTLGKEMGEKSVY